jgi:hypothetical protein
MDLERTILMIEDQENVVLVVPLPKQENANGDVELHAHIDGGDIAIELDLLQLLPHPSFQMERMGEVFFVKSVFATPSLIVVLKPLHAPPSISM